MKIDWNKIYNHEEWSKDQVSIMNPLAKVTWPQFIAEMVVWNRTKIISSYKNIQRGPGWSSAIPSDVRKLIQQAYAIANCFPHPKNEPLVYVAFKNYFRNHRVLKIGQLRKTRIKDNKLMITKEEKDIIVGVTAELNRLMAQRDIFVNTKPTEPPVVSTEPTTFRTENQNQQKSSLSNLLALEQKIKVNNGENGQ
jgi:hypothetical protein